MPVSVGKVQVRSTFLNVMDCCESLSDSWQTESIKGIFVSSTSWSTSAVLLLLLLLLLSFCPQQSLPPASCSDFAAARAARYSRTTLSRSASAFVSKFAKDQEIAAYKFANDANWN